MKRITSLFIAFAMLLALMPMNISAADNVSFSDVNSSDYYAEAAETLAQLEVLTGYPDGTFGAEKSITRAEMAAVVCRMIGRGTAEKTDTAFEDVNASHWASGYINIASKEGIISGDGNGKFRPDDNVKHEEAIKMVVCALGYGEDIEKDPSDWSAGYLKVAEELGISDNLKGEKGKASARGDVAVMSFNGVKADLAMPKASVGAGSYTKEQRVALSTETKNAEIYYTLDGSEPTVNSSKYTTAIPVSAACTLKAITVKNGVLSSDVLSVSYSFKKATVEVASMPTSNKPAKANAFTVAFDLNCKGATNAPKSQSVKKGKTATMPEAPEREGYLFVGWYVDKSFSELFDFETEITKDYTLVARWIDIADKTDTDGDGLTDPFEAYYGTDKTKADTDGDGLTDAIEIVTLKLDPLKEDTDKDGTNDGDEDTDSDGLTNVREIELGTSPVLEDSDGDGLVDKEEIDTYNTDPIKEDTDGDGASDGTEVELGTDPLSAQTTFAMNVSSNEQNDSVKASVSMNLSGDQVDTLSVNAVEDDAFFPDTMPGYMGKAYDFNVEGSFDKATISFEFDPSMARSGSNLAIFYFNEETQELEELPTTINGNVASAEVTHFSKYILIDRDVWEEAFAWQDVWESEQTYTDVEVVFVIDDSGSMSWNDPGFERLAVARTLVDKLPANSKIGLVRFDGGYPKTEALTPSLTTDREVVKNFLTTNYFYSPGGTDMYNGIQKAFPLYESDEDTTLKLMIVLSDGETEDTYLHSSVIDTANENNIKIYTVGLGSSSSSYFNSYMQPLAEDTGAKFYLADEADQLADIYEDISEKIDLSADSDDDGIPDYYEDNMVAFNGVKLNLNKYVKDTDGDDIPDGEELKIIKIPSPDGKKVKVSGRLILGHPALADTDGDGFNDKEDSEPFKWNISDRDLAMCCGIVYQDIPEGVRLDTLEKTYPSMAQGINGKKTFGGAAELSELKGWSVLETWYAYGLQAAAYVKDKNIVIAYRGSEDLGKFNSYEFWADWVVSDAIGLITGFNAEVPFAKTFAKNITKSFSGYNIYVTGHSLGGNLAYNAASAALSVDEARVKKITVHNGLGLLSGLTFGVTDWADAGRLKDNAHKIKNFRVEGDVVSVLPTTFHYGTPKDVKRAADAKGAHDMYSFYVNAFPRSAPNAK